MKGLDMIKINYFLFIKVCPCNVIATHTQDGECDITHMYMGQQYVCMCMCV